MIGVEVGQVEAGAVLCEACREDLENGHREARTARVNDEFGPVENKVPRNLFLNFLKFRKNYFHFKKVPKYKFLNF